VIGILDITCCLRLKTLKVYTNESVSGPPSEEDIMTLFEIFCVFGLK